MPILFIDRVNAGPLWRRKSSALWFIYRALFTTLLSPILSKTGSASSSTNYLREFVVMTSYKARCLPGLRMSDVVWSPHERPLAERCLYRGSSTLSRSQNAASRRSRPRSNFFLTSFATAVSAYISQRSQEFSFRVFFLLFSRKIRLLRYLDLIFLREKDHGLSLTSIIHAFSHSDSLRLSLTHLPSNDDTISNRDLWGIETLDVVSNYYCYRDVRVRLCRSWPSIEPPSDSSHNESECVSCTLRSGVTRGSVVRPANSPGHIYDRRRNVILIARVFCSVSLNLTLKPTNPNSHYVAKKFI